MHTWLTNQDTERYICCLKNGLTTVWACVSQKVLLMCEARSVCRSFTEGMEKAPHRIKRCVQIIPHMQTQTTTKLIVCFFDWLKHNLQDVTNIGFCFFFVVFLCLTQVGKSALQISWLLMFSLSLKHCWDLYPPHSVANRGNTKFINQDTSPAKTHKKESKITVPCFQK